MKQFTLKIVTPDGVRYEGPAEEVAVRTTTGDMGIMAAMSTTLSQLMVMEGERRYGACIGGMITVVGGNVNIVATTFEWADQIDPERAAASEERARAVLSDKSASDKAHRMAEARLKRALIRQNIANR